MPDPANLMPKAFWEDVYYGNPQLPLEPSPDFSYERTLASALEEMAPVAAGASVIEIGCAPGRWLVWYAKRFDARVRGLEYSKKGAELSQANLRAAGLPPDVVQRDFFDELVEHERSTLVLSLGFIEHFDDLRVAFRRHLDFVEPHGRVAIGVPNFRGMTGLMQRWASPEFLAQHNHAAMDPELFRGFAHEHGWELEDHRYIGSFDPNVIHVRRHGPAAVLLPLGALRRLRFTDRLNHPRLSSYLMMTFRAASG